MSNSTLPYGQNAWIFLNEDEPKGTFYDSPNSCYQTLINHKIYDSVSFLGLAFFEVTPASTGHTIKVGDSTHKNGQTNQDYANFIIRDSRQVNPKIKILATMGYGNNTLPDIFSAGGDVNTEATEFANNLVTYLKDNQMNGLDIDWEGSATGLTNTQFTALFTAIRTAFDAQSEKFYLTMAPASTYNIVVDTLNSTFDIVSPQFYDGSVPSDYLSQGFSPSIFGYGAQFEPGNSAPNASAQQVYNAVSPGFSQGGAQYPYQDIFMWRFNSGNYQFEQAQFMILDQLFNPPTGDTFDDSSIIEVAGNPNITQMTIRSGDVLDAIQSVNTGNGEYNFGTQPRNTTIGVYTLLQHGGNGGSSQTINIPLTDPIVTVEVTTGNWYGWNCVVQLTLIGSSKTKYGPFGTMAGASGQSTTTYTAPSGQSVVAFKGSTTNVPLSGGGNTDIIASLQAVFG